MRPKNVCARVCVRVPFNASMCIVVFCFLLLVVLWCGPSHDCMIAPNDSACVSLVAADMKLI